MAFEIGDVVTRAIVARFLAGQLNVVTLNCSGDGLRQGDFRFLSSSIFALNGALSGHNQLITLDGGRSDGLHAACGPHHRGFKMSASLLNPEPSRRTTGNRQGPFAQKWITGCIYGATCGQNAEGY